MGDRRGEAHPELKDFQIGCSWIPTTPAKPNSTSQQPICANWQANVPGQTIWIEPGQYTPLTLATQANLCDIQRLPPDYVQIAQRQTLPTCHNSSLDLNDVSRANTANSNVLEETLSNFDTWRASETANPHGHGGFLSTPDKFSTTVANNMGTMSFQKLLALANAGAVANQAAIENELTDIGPRNDWLENVVRHRDFTPGFRPLVESCRYTMSYGNPGLMDRVDLIGATFDTELELASRRRGESSVPSRPSFDLNTPAFSSSMPFQLEPLTPQKTDKAEYCHGAPLISIDEVDLTQLQENHKTDKGGTDEVDLTKTPRLKSRRKKHRPKVIIEGQQKRAPKSKPSSPQETTTVERKGVTDSLEQEINRTDFNNSSMDNPMAKRMYARRKGLNKIEVDLGNEIIKTTEVKSTRVTRNSCRRSLNFNSEQNKDLRKDSMLGNQTVRTRGKCQIVFSNVTDDKETDIVQMRTNRDGQRTPKNPSDSNLTSERRVRGLKRQNVGTISESEIIRNRNENNRTYYNFMHAHLPIFSQNADENNGSPGLHFPTFFKKKRTNKESQQAASSGGQCHFNMLTSPVIDRTRDGRKIYENMLGLGPTEKIRKKRSKGPTRLRDLASLIEICRQLPASASAATTSRMRQNNAILHEPNTCMQALVADTRTTMKKKKRTKRSMISNPTMLNLYNRQKSTILPMGPPLSLTWKSTSPVDSITERLNQLDLNSERNQKSAGKQNAILAYHTHYQEQHALVPFRRSGALIPFDGSFDRVRRRRPRPKVNLDDETTRVWKLLLENINSEGIDGNDEEKSKWWEEERTVFNGRANSFIARMHLVQGDRRFSPWKGSVVDSVVGVFLTQNVSDHLSSSAFMSVASRFPLKTKSQLSELHDEKLGTEEVCDLDRDGTFIFEDKILNQSISDDYTKMRQDFGGDTVTEVNNISPAENTLNKSVSLIIDEAEDTLSYQTPDISSQNSSNSPIAQTTESSESSLPNTSEKPNSFVNPTSFVKLLQMAETALYGVYEEGSNKINSDEARNSTLFNSCSDKELCSADMSGSSSGTTFHKTTNFILETGPIFCSSTNAASSNNDSGEINPKMVENQEGQVPAHCLYFTGSSSNIVNLNNPEQKGVDSNKNDIENRRSKRVDGPKANGGRPRKEKENQVDWDYLRKQAHASGTERARLANAMDSVDWDAVRCADVNEIAQTIKERGMNNMLAERIKDFLNRLVRDHGSIDLEWLRDVPPDKAKEYLLSIRGLGLKSVECVRLLTLHHLAFPVDTNVGRIAVRLGWVPLQPLPESLQLHLLELYPVMESIQKYLWPRLCKLDQKTLYELHYQMITFGKVFCTKSKPNCNACPMRGECRHFASAFASARFALPAPEDKSIVSATGNSKNRTADQNPFRRVNTLQLPSPETTRMDVISGVSNSQPIIEEPPSPGPIIEVPATPEQDYSQCDIEDAFNEDPDDIPTIRLNMEEFTHNLQKIMQQNTELHEGNMSKALVALTSAAASIPVPKLKNISRLRTEHQVYELPDSHPLLEGMERREPDDPCPYLLAIWTPGETANSIEPPERRCCSQEFETLCTDETCSSCNSMREASSHTVRGTILIPCRTAMRGSFPLNGTYFQVNEVFSDHESSLSPIDVPRQWLWNLPRRTVYFGTSIPTIFKGLTTEGIQYCFWRGFVCVRGFDRKTRAPRPLIARLHFPASRLAKGKGKR